ncbi:Transposable element P transposase [Orchesella cincta]|uniref:Transposable element P transposase n=1 Tax=Orchesella cincta TaxID=48709 RepID=A0A1D2MUB4_ORCCI|nr:Transposable element P transposase [Orchesella cincta]
MWERKYHEELRHKTELQNRLDKLQKQIAASNDREKATSEKLNGILSRFSPGQKKMLEAPHKSYIHWENEDIIKGLSLYSISPKAYELVQKSWNIPLPSIPTLKRHLAKFPIVPDKPFPAVFKMLNTKFINEQFNSLKTQCILAVGEVYIDHKFCYDPNSIKYLVERKTPRFAARGLFNPNWKMPLMYSFTQQTSQISELIELLYENGLNVVGCVSDNGPKNQKMWRQLQIGNVEKGVVKNISFRHPVTGNNIFWFPDFHIF